MTRIAAPVKLTTLLLALQIFPVALEQQTRSCTFKLVLFPVCILDIYAT